MCITVPHCFWSLFVGVYFLVNTSNFIIIFWKAVGLTVGRDLYVFEIAPKFSVVIGGPPPPRLLAWICVWSLTSSACVLVCLSLSS